MSRTALIYSIVLSLLIVNLTTAQAPTLDPSQTVNTATGEMGFSLPLCNVEDINGRGFPIQLSYAAGIRSTQRSSSVGLGFGIGVGTIVKKVVLIPDDATNASSTSENECYLVGWKDFLTGFLSWVGLAISLVAIAFDAYPVAAAIVMIIGFLASSANLMIQNTTFSPGNYVAGGTHLEQYDYENGNKKGFLVEDGYKNDLPDEYFINTPFLSGQMIYDSKDDNGFRFVLKSSTSKENAIIYLKDNVFSVLLNDGTKLKFEIYSKSKTTVTTEGYCTKDDNSCDLALTQSTDPVIDCWCLTKVIFPNFTGDESNIESCKTGGWISLKYINTNLDNQLGDNNVEAGCGFWSGVQANYCSKSRIDLKKSNLVTIKEIRTVKQHAVFEYEYNRYDDFMWANDNLVNYDVFPLLLPKLTGIILDNNSNHQLKQVKLITDYTLRPSSPGSRALRLYNGKKYLIPDENGGVKAGLDLLKYNNYSDGSLTLKRVDFYSLDVNNKTPESVFFGYDSDANYPYKNYYGACKIGGRDWHAKHASFDCEQRDLWGYFSDAVEVWDGGTQYCNDFNTIGEFSKANKSNAWSLNSAYFQNGSAIKWCYEVNRYDKANTVSVHSAVGKPKYGGGIRVKEINVDDGAGKKNTINYFYTTGNTPVEFEETDLNSSGHATAEPFPYIETNDPRNNLTKGGHYTPAKVAYEKVIVANNYDKVLKKAPFGYTIYDYITSADYLNTGKYGQNDMSCLRGFLKSKAVYNSAGKVLEKNTLNYDFQLHKKLYSRSRGGDDCQMLWAEVKGKNVMNTSYGIEKSREYRYAAIGTPDAINSDKVHLVKYVNDFGLAANESLELFYASTKLFGDHNKDDLLIVTAKSCSYFAGTHFKSYKRIGFMIIQDIEYDATGIACTYRNQSEFIDNIAYQEGNYGNSLPILVTKNIIVDELQDGAALGPEIYISCQTLSGPIKEMKLASVSVSSDNKVWRNESGANFTSPSKQGSFCRVFDQFDNFGSEVTYFNEHAAIGDLDGQPNEVWETAPDGKKLVSKPVPAYWKYGAMGTVDATHPNNKHMLTQPCQTIIYQKAAGDNTPVSPSEVLSSQITTYSDKLGSAAWLPYQSYSWNVIKNSSGLPTFTDFNFSNSLVNTDWQLNSTINKYSVAGLPLQTTPAKLAPSTLIYRNDVHLPIASIARANYSECAVLTCDYDDGQDPAFYDKENGWGKGAGNEANPPLPGPESRVCEEAKHFGNKGVKVTNAFGPTRAFKLEKGRDYIFSAWIKKVAGNVPLQNGMVIGIDYRKRKSAEGVWPLDLYLATEITPISCNSTLKVVPHGDWYYIELPVNAKTDIPKDKWNEGYQYGAAWVGVPNGNGSHGDATVYIDDIRFYPKDALVTSTYYNESLGLPIVTVDANNNPGRKLTYDGFGRPVTWEKLDLSKSTTEAGYATVVMKKEYHLMGSFTPVYTNDYETGNVDFNTDDCSNAVIVSNGYNSSHCLKIENRITCYQTLLMNTSLFDKKIYVLKGYYKVDQELDVEIRYANATENGFLSEQVLPVTSDWTEFSLYFDLSGVTWPLTVIAAHFYGRIDSDFPAYNLYLDDLNVGYIE